MHKTNPVFSISGRKIGPDFPPFVIVEIGINHEGSMKKAKKMVDDAAAAGAECVKFQSHVVEDEMSQVAKKIVPGHTTENIWDIMKRCAFSEKQEVELKKYVEEKGMLYLCTPFSRAAAERLIRMKVEAFKIGSGECNNYPLIEHIAQYGKPVILSTGMNNLDSIKQAAKIFKKYKTPFALLHCTSMYPTPYEKVRLGAISDLQATFPDTVIGSSDHSLGVWTCLGATTLGASIFEKHFTSNKKWPGPDIAISIDPGELQDLITGTNAVWQARGGSKDILPDEQDIINFAYACVVTIKPIKKGESFSKENIWVKRPGTGEIKAKDFTKVLRKRAARDLPADVQVANSDIA
ncbi:N-acetylneuraminate synthase family protein [Candidatus Woesebacteria bacterium]|nr:N-acetylneuraminate synthase family protein [Candidatus Woesebacteria bacterium]